jgi:hypothetical protein
VIEITSDRLRELLHYNPETGIFTRRLDRGGHKAGEIMGSGSHRGYKKIGIDMHRYYAHRLAWLYVYGEMPTVIDHINGDTLDNRIENLRNVDQLGNLQNIRQLSKANTSGFTGVSRKRNKWTAALSLNNENIRLGVYETKQAAHTAYVEAKRKFHPMSML